MTADTLLVRARRPTTRPSSTKTETDDRPPRAGEDWLRAAVRRPPAHRRRANGAPARTTAVASTCCSTTTASTGCGSGSGYQFQCPRAHVRRGSARGSNTPSAASARSTASSSSSRWCPRRHRDRRLDGARARTTTSSSRSRTSRTAWRSCSGARTTATTSSARASAPTSRARCPSFSTVSVHVRNDDYRSLPLDRGTRSCFHREPRRCATTRAIDEGESHTRRRCGSSGSRTARRARAPASTTGSISSASGHGLGGDFDYTRAARRLRSVVRLSPATTLALRAWWADTSSTARCRSRSSSRSAASTGCAPTRSRAYPRRSDRCSARPSTRSGSGRCARGIFQGGLHAIAFVDAGRAWSNPATAGTSAASSIQLDGGFGLGTSEDNLRVYFARNSGDAGLGFRGQREAAAAVLTRGPRVLPSLAFPPAAFATRLHGVGRGADRWSGITLAAPSRALEVALDPPRESGGLRMGRRAPRRAILGAGGAEPRARHAGDAGRARRSCGGGAAVGSTGWRAASRRRSRSATRCGASSTGSSARAPPTLSVGSLDSVRAHAVAAARACRSGGWDGSLPVRATTSWLRRSLKPLSVEDIEEGEGWLSGEVESKRRAGIGFVTAIPRSVFDAVRNFAGFGDERARAISPDFLLEDLFPGTP